MRFGRILTVLLAVVLSVLCLSGCKTDEPANEAVYFTVKFNSAGGTEIEDMKVLSGNKISEPAEPEKEGHIFNGWRNGVKSWNFASDTVTADVTLTASWINAGTIFETEKVDDDGDKVMDRVILTEYIGSLSSFTIPSVIDGLPVTDIGDGAFSSSVREELEGIVIGENIKSVGESAFANCTGLSIKVESKLSYVGEKAFYGCDGLESIELGEGLECVPYQAFSGCTALRTVVLPSTVSSIEENAFEFCSSLQTVTVHSALKTVGDSAFKDCSSLVTVFYYGTAENWAETEIAEGNDGNDTFAAARFYMYSETKPDESTEGEYWYFDGDGDKRIW